jgi:hypothetical protein
MKRGFPRPRTFIEQTSRHPSRYCGNYGDKWNNKSYPHPYNAENDCVAEINSGRIKESIQFKVCGTCGTTIEEDLVGLVIYNQRSDKTLFRGPYHKRPLLHTESGPYHIKCMVMNFTMCPHLVELKTFLPAIASWTDVGPQLRELLAEIP